MKKTLVFLLSTLLIIGMFVSCEANVQPKGTALVKFDGEIMLNKSLNASVAYESDLDWYYMADAVIENFNYGEKSEWTAVPETVELSLGVWNFELKAVKARAGAAAKAVYAGSLDGFLVKPSDSVVSIEIPVVAQAGGEGTLVIAGDVYIALASDPTNTTVKPNNAKIGEMDAITLNGEDKSVPLDSGSYAVRVWYVDDADGLIKADETITVSVFNGATTTISGFISEITQDVDIEGDITESFGDVSTAISTVVIPTTEITGEANVVKTTGESATVVSNGALSVTIPVGTVLVVEEGVDAGKVKTGLTAVENSEAENLTIATIDNAKVFDLTLNVSEGNETLIKVEYQVGAGLDITSVYHNDEALEYGEHGANGEYYEYDSATGVLTLHIYHASYITIVEGDELVVSNEAALKVAMGLGGDIVFANDIDSSGIVVESGSVISIDLNGNTWTIGAPLVGSTGTETLGLQLLEGSDIEFKNGTIKNRGECKMLIQNYSDLILEDVTLDNSTVWEAEPGTPPRGYYALSNNCGKIVIKGNTNIIADEDDDVYKVAFDSCDYADYDPPTVTFDETFTGKVTGKIERNDDAKIVIKAGTFEVADISSLKVLLGENVETNENVVIKLIGDIISSEIITISNPITVDGNNNELVSTAGRAINVSGADGVTIKNLTINCSGERGINVIQNSKKVTIDNVTATAANYTVNLAGSAPNAIVSIVDSVLTGKNSVNVAASGAKVSVDDCTINCIDNSNIERYAALVLNKDAKDATLEVTNSVINVGGNSQKAKNAAEDGILTIDGFTDDVAVMVAAIEYGDYYYSFESLEEAIEYAEESEGEETIILLRDITADAEIVVPDGVEVVLDLNGHSINAPETTGNHIYVMSNKGTLTISDTSAEQDGSINSRGIYNYGSLTLDSGKISAIDGNGGYAVNNESGSTFVMNGGWIAADYDDGDAPVPGNYDATALDVPSDCTATLNAGKITNAGNFTFAVASGGTLNIPKTSTITIEGRHGAIYVSGGITTINDGTFSIPENTESTDNVTYITGGQLIINGGTFIADNDGPNGGTCVSDGNGCATINGGIFGNSSGGDVCGKTGGTTINGGTFENLTEISHVAEGKTIVNGGKTYTKVDGEMVEQN